MFAASVAAPGAQAGGWVPAIAAFGSPKYPADFTHFEYVNPDAPKGGTLYLRNPDRRTSFDKFNLFTVKGNAPAGIGIYMLETLAVMSADEPRTMYGLLAESMRVEPDGSAITFRLNPRARFSNGDSLIAADVKYSFDSQSGKYAAPGYNTVLAGVSKAVVLDDHTIRFELADRSSDTLFRIGTMMIFSHKWGLQADGTYKRFDEIVSEIPLATGPYTVDVADSGRRIEFKRNPDYWARDLPVRRGMFNFDRIVYRYYQDEEIATEAFKAGEFDLVRVYGAPIWARQHRGPKWDDGRIVKAAFPISTGEGLQAYDINLRRPLFQDIRVREALDYSFDFETNNRYHLFKRANSVFNNSEFAAEGLPSPGELKLLEPYRSELPKEVFGPPFVAPRTDGDPHALRRNLLKARALLEAAGWKLDASGRLRNAKGEPFEFEYLSPGEDIIAARMNAWARNLEKLGIRLTVRNVDFALYNRRLEEYDYDMITIVEGSFGLPSVVDYVALYGSKSADEKGNGNFRGVKSAAVDHILEAMSRATTIDEFRDACRALDRVVMWNYWQVPELYSDHELMSYWNKFGIPAVRARYFTADLPPDVDPQLAWPITCWWIKDSERR
ncbi:MAG TPA: extracellular solute-binding protein [Burkholderiaceae bacterium]|nr:extracellular solute-binding protein [Burkholderiaceae bacterium]